MRKLPTAVLASALASTMLLGGCGVIYKVDVYQGSLLEKKNVEQLQTGFTKRQVFALLGSPSVQDPFHQSRWDYVATVSKRGRQTEVKNLVLTFDGDSLASIEGDYFPEQDEALAKEMRRYGNLPRDKDKERRGAGRGR
jgi:outer membrane protein assembly factor BamE